MRGLLMLGMLALPFIAFAFGRVTADRRPGNNHQAMAIFLAELLAADNLTAILTREQQRDAQRLVDEFTNNTTTDTDKDK